MRRLTLAALVLMAAPLAAESGREFHFKTEMTGAGLPSALLSETWVKGEHVRVETQTPMGPSSIVIKDKTMYTKMGGMAMKMSLDQQRKGMTPPRAADYAQALDEKLKGGTKVGTETVDGELCDKWVVKRTDEGRASEETIWISPSLHFPRKVVVKMDKGEMTMHNTDIKTKVDLDAKMFEPEDGVTYMDMSEMMKRSQGGQPPR